MPTRAESHTGTESSHPQARRSHIIVKCSERCGPREDAGPPFMATIGDRGGLDITGHLGTAPNDCCTCTRPRRTPASAHSAARTAWKCGRAGVADVGRNPCRRCRSAPDLGHARVHHVDPTVGAVLAKHGQARLLRPRARRGTHDPSSAAKYRRVWRGNLLRHSDSTVPSGTFGTPRCPYGPPAFR